MLIKFVFLPFFFSFIVSYNELINEEENLTADQLKTDHQEIEEKYPNIWSYTEEDVVALERKLEDLSTTEEFYEDLVVKMK